MTMDTMNRFSADRIAGGGGFGLVDSPPGSLKEHLADLGIPQGNLQERMADLGVRQRSLPERLADLGVAPLSLTDRLAKLGVSQGNLLSPGVLGGVSAILPAVDTAAPADALYRPPRPARAAFADQAAAAMMRILEKLDPTLGASTGVEGKKGLGLHDVASASMDTLMLAASLLGSRVLSDTVSAKSRAIEIMGQAQEAARTEELRAYQEQMDKAIADQAKAQKAGIFSVIFDWIVAVVEIATGIGKLIVGDYAGGLMDLGAGLAGLVKATAGTLALLMPDQAEKFREVADIAGKVQLGFEIAGAAVSLVQTGRGIMAARSVVSGSASAMKGASGQALGVAIKEGNKQAASSVAHSIGKEVADNVAQQVSQNMSKIFKESVVQVGKTAAEKAAAKMGLTKLAQNFSKTGIESLVSKSVEQVAHQAIKKGVTLTGEKLAQTVERQVRMAVIKTALKSGMTAISGVRTAVLPAARQITSSSIAKERADLQKVIQDLMLDQAWLDTCAEFFEEAKKADLKSMKELISDQATVMQGASQALNQAGATQAQIVAAIA
ncbi:type III secretion system translocon subunit SctE [Paludibacterium yongneupense]|uniref:type III secretion system translocon subunit SctE n=1 Tax=Paludibacterium yongneupense TaxID=400061 RepID=UPI0004260DE6|nr:type III secretion system translocon subunit SctE [Paludibacterium yongneupense]